MEEKVTIIKATDAGTGESILQLEKYENVFNYHVIFVAKNHLSP